MLEKQSWGKLGVQLDQHLQDIDKRTQAAVAEIEATRDRLESAVKAWRRRLKGLAMSTSADVKTAVHDGKTLPSNGAEG